MSKTTVIQFNAQEEGNFHPVDESVTDLYSKILTFPDCAHLRNFKVKLIFTSKEMKAKGKRILGKAMLCSERDKFLHGYDFLIILDQEFWATSKDSREPLLYHEILHCGIDPESEEPKLIAHDVEEFGAVIARYGMWKSDVKDFCEQMELFNRTAAQG